MFSQTEEGKENYLHLNVLYSVEGQYLHSFLLHCDLAT